MATFFSSVAFRGSKDPSFRNRTMDSAATFLRRSVDSGVSTVRSRPSPSRTYVDTMEVLEGSKMLLWLTYLRCTLGAFLDQFQDLFGALFDGAYCNLPGLDRPVDKV